MATKVIKWENNKIARITILDGIAKADYLIDIETYANQPCCGLITIGMVGKTEVKVRVDDIPDYQEHYNQTPNALINKREEMAIAINALHDELNNKNAYWQEHGFEGPMPNLDKEIIQARNDLMDFDATYPKIIKNIELDNKNTAERHIWD